MILSTAYLGNIQYYTKLLSGEAVVDLHENYQKQSYRNRCEILSANGVDTLTVPVLQPSGIKTQAKDIRIDNTKKWQHRHFQAIISAYRSSPFWFYYEDEIALHYWKRYDFLIDLNNELQETILKMLKTDIRPVYAEQAIPFTDTPDDFRHTISPKERLQRPDLDFISQPYYQVFSERYDFIPNLSIIDLLCCEGPSASDILLKK